MWCLSLRATSRFFGERFYAEHEPWFSRCFQVFGSLLLGFYRVMLEDSFMENESPKKSPLFYLACFVGMGLLWFGVYKLAWIEAKLESMWRQEARNEQIEQEVHQQMEGLLRHSEELHGKPWQELSIEEDQPVLPAADPGSPEPPEETPPGAE